MRFREIKQILTIIIFSILLLTVQAQPSYGSVLKGTIYSWETLEPLPKTILIINTTPEQKIVSEDGRYMINISEGNYSLKAFYYEYGEIRLFSEESISIKDEGTYNIDLILFPPLTDIEFEEPTDIDINLSLENDSLEKEEQNQIPIYHYLSILPIVLLLMIVWRYKKGKTKRKVTEIETEKGAMSEKRVLTSFTEDDLETDERIIEPQMKKEQSLAEAVDTREEEQGKDLTLEVPSTPPKLPDDLKLVMDIIESKDGRITQKELRKRTGYSEAKMSLAIADLERRGLVEKVKKGRGNIIFLKE